MKLKRGFTIVELLMVIAIIGVLLGIVTTAASSAMKNSRIRRRDALCKIVQAGIATYHAREGEWPIGKDKLKHASGDNKEDEKRQYGNAQYNDDPNKHVLRRTEVRDCVKKLVEETKSGRPVMDVSGLFVSDEEGRYGQKCHGLDFWTAQRGTKRHQNGISIAQMYYGYPEVNHGYFRHFKIVYLIPSDEMIVTHMDEDAQEQINCYDK